MLSTKTNLEITEYHEKFFLGLSLRQLACFGVAAMLAIAICFVCLHLQLKIYVLYTNARFFPTFSLYQKYRKTHTFH